MASTDTKRRNADRAIRSPAAHRKDDAEIARLLREMFPGRNRTQRLSRAFERSRTSIEEIMAGRKVPRDVRLIVGLLRACPYEDWPIRWIGPGPKGWRGLRH